MLFDKEELRPKEEYKPPKPEVIQAEAKQPEVKLDPLMQEFLDKLEKFYIGNARFDIKAKDKKMREEPEEYKIWLKEATAHLDTNYIKFMEEMDAKIAKAHRTEEAWKLAKERGIEYDVIRRKLEPAI